MSAGKQFPLSPLSIDGINRLRNTIDAKAGALVSISSEPFDQADVTALEDLARIARPLYRRATMQHQAGDFS